MQIIETPIPHGLWLDTDTCIAGFSTRKGGVSSGVYESMNTGLHSKDDAKNVKQNRQLFFDVVAPGFRVANLKQIHSADIVRVDSFFCNDVEADGFYTTEKGVILSVSIADCGSVLFHNDDFSLIAGLHCGWKGTRDGIIQNMVKILSGFSHPQSLTAYVGPMIQQENYQVGEEFLGFFPRQFFCQKEGSYYFDLNSCVEQILHDCNVGTVYNAKLDTFSNKDLFYSYRRDGQTGRMCSYIGLKK